MAVSRHQNVGQNDNLLIANKSLEIVERFKHWEQQSQIKVVFMKKLRTD
jgi:hypothetical protein